MVVKTHRYALSDFYKTTLSVCQFLLAKWQTLKTLHGSTHFAHFGHGLHHLFHLFKLFDEIVNLTNSGARTLGYSSASASVEYAWVLTLFRRHRIDYGFDGLKSVITEICIFYCFAGAGDHRDEVGKVPHLFDLLNLIQKIFQIEFFRADAFLQAICFFGIKFFLSFFNE